MDLDDNKITPIYEHIVLTEKEKEDAILEGKKKKYFHERNKDYWKDKPGAYEGDKGSMTGSSF